MANDSLDVNPAASVPAEEYSPTPVVREEHAEDQITRMIEQQAAKLPSDLFLFAAVGAMGLSVVLEVVGNTRASRFVGMWPPAILTMGIYNKLVKVLGTR